MRRRTARYSRLIPGVLALVALLVVTVIALQRLAFKLDASFWISIGIGVAIVVVFFAAVVVLILAILFLLMLFDRISWFHALEVRLRPLLGAVFLVIQVLAVVATVIGVVQTLFPHSSPVDIWARDVEPLLAHGTPLDYVKAAVIVVVGVVVSVVGFIVVPSRVARWLVRKSLPLLSLAVLRSLVQFVVTLADLVLIGALVYACYWLGLFPRTAASDLFVTAAGATALKIGVSAAFLAGKGIVSGIFSYIGYQGAQKVAAAHKDPQKSDGEQT